MPFAPALLRSLAQAAQHFLLAGVMLFFWGRAKLNPASYRALLQEDAWAEWSTFLAFSIAGLFALFLALRKARPRLLRLLLLGLGLFCLFVAGEEISWGHRLFAFRPPEIFLAHNYQQEPNLHNMFKRFLDTRWMVLAVALLYGVLFPVLARGLRLPESLRRLAPSFVMTPWFLLVAYLEYAYPLKFVGEVAELFLGLAFLGDLALRWEERSFEARSLAAVALQLLALVGALGLEPAMFRVAYGEQSAAIRQAEREIELLERDLHRPGTIRSKVRTVGKVHKRLYTAVVNGYVRFGSSSTFLEGRPSVAETKGDSARHDRLGYFLDPWNQPYWFLVYSHTGQRLVRIYSFGPNRRRDSDTKTTGGDDIQRTFRLSEAFEAAGQPPSSESSP